MKWLKKIALVLFALILVTSLMLWIFAKNINSDTIKQLVSKQITTLTHKNSHLDGPISWQLIPRPGLKFTDIKVGNEDSNEYYSLSIKTLLLKLKIAPLLKGNFVFSDINLDGLDLHINSDAPAGVSINNKTTPNGSNDKNTTNQFNIERLLLSHGQISINKNGHTLIFKNIQIGMEQFNLKNIPFPIQIKAKLTALTPNPISKATINFNGRFSLTPNIIDEFRSETIKSILEGQLIVQDILINQFSIKKINATIKTSKSEMTFNPITLSLYNGESIGDMSYVFATHQLLINQTATNLDGKLLLTALLNQEAVNGNLDYSIHASIPFNKSGIEQISGSGNVTIKNGELLNLNLAQMIHDLKDKLTQIINEKSQRLEHILQLTDWDKDKYRQGSTPFKLLSFQYQLQNAMITTDSLILQTDNVQIKGDAQLNLNNHDLKSKLRASVNSANDSSMQKIQNLLGANFPLLISGTLEHPILLPDFSTIKSILSQSIIKAEIAKPLKQLKEELKLFIH